VKLLLDTCALIWLMTGERPLPDRVIRDLATNDVIVSAASAWEIAIKHAKGALRLSQPPHQLVPAARSRYRFSSLAVDEESALHVAKLPLLHADPFDRILVSQAIVHGLTIVTPDPLVTQYPARTMW
jgi:PIN domain nuclease of toxin-antitoxin system